MAKKSKAEAAIDSRIDRAYRATCSGVKINIMGEIVDVDGDGYVIIGAEEVPPCNP